MPQLAQLKLGSCQLRNVKYRVEFADSESCPITGVQPGSTVVRIEAGGTAFDVMQAAADKDRNFNFQTKYFGNIGFSVRDIGGTESVPSDNCFWFFYYIIPGVRGEIRSSLGVSNLIIPGDNWQIILRYMLYRPDTDDH